MKIPRNWSCSDLFKLSFTVSTNAFQALSRERLRGLQPEELLLVDDERENVEGAMRYCKVARYDEVYRNCGPLNQLLARP